MTYSNKEERKKEKEQYKRKSKISSCENSILHKVKIARYTNLAVDASVPKNYNCMQVYEYVWNMINENILRVMYCYNVS